MAAAGPARMAGVAWPARPATAMGTGKQRAWSARPLRPPGAAALLIHLGRTGAQAWIDAWRATTGEPAAVGELFDALIEPPAIPRDAPPCNGRAQVEELEDCLGHLAAAHPGAFIAGVEARPQLRHRFDVLAVLGRIDDPRTTAWLLDALGQRAGSNRWVALCALLRRHQPTARARLRALLSDRDHLVAFEAADGLRRWGGVDDLPALLAYAERAQIGGRERAFDAIEMICGRSGAPLPAVHPGRRLTVVATPPGTRLRHGVSTALLVDRGTPLADAGGQAVLAPRGGVVCGLDFDAGGQLQQIVIRRDHRARGA